MKQGVSEMGRLENLENWLEDHILIVCAVTLIILLALLGIACFIGGDDGRPGWANDMAGQLDEKGGRIDYYGDAVRDYTGATPIYRIYVSVDQDVYADAKGIIIKDGNGLIQVPYERICGIFPGGI